MPVTSEGARKAAQTPEDNDMQSKKDSSSHKRDQGQSDSHSTSSSHSDGRSRQAPSKEDAAKSGRHSQ